MANVSQQRRRLLGGAVAAAVTGVTVISGGRALSRRSPPQNEYIQIQSANLIEQSGRWLFDYRASIDLPSAIRAGLESGVPLQFIVALTVHEPVRYWRDKVLLQANYPMRLVYYELTRHYRVQTVDENRSVNKRSLLAALDELGRLQQVDVTKHVIDSKTLLKPSSSAVASVSITLDSSALPLPLQPLFSSNWRLASEEYVWPLS
jgi:hypothetical protein